MLPTPGPKCACPTAIAGTHRTKSVRLRRRSFMRVVSDSPKDYRRWSALGIFALTASQNEFAQVLIYGIRAALLPFKDDLRHRCGALRVRTSTMLRFTKGTGSLTELTGTEQRLFLGVWQSVVRISSSLNHDRRPRSGVITENCNPSGFLQVAVSKAPNTVFVRASRPARASEDTTNWRTTRPSGLFPRTPQFRHNPP